MHWMIDQAIGYRLLTLRKTEGFLEKQLHLQWTRGCKY